MTQGMEYLQGHDHSHTHGAEEHNHSHTHEAEEHNHESYVYGRKNIITSMSIAMGRQLQRMWQHMDMIMEMR